MLHFICTHIEIYNFPLIPSEVFIFFLFIIHMDISITVHTMQRTVPVTRRPTSVSHLLLVPRDPFGFDGAQGQAGQHVVQDLRHKNLQTIIKRSTMKISV